jgi:hypothetical protein
MSLMVALGLDSTALDTGLAGAEKNATNVAGSIGTGLLSVGKAAVIGAGAAVTAIGGLVLKTAAEADALSELSLKTGISVNDLQEMDYIGKQVGVSLDTMTGSLSFLTRNMYAAQGGTGAQAGAFAALGVSVVDANGNLRDGVAVQAEVFAALAKMPNETERNAMAMQLFGRSAMELNPLIKTSAAELDSLRQAAHDSGAVMSDATVSGAADLQDSLDGLKSSVGGTLGSLASVFVPTFQGMVTGAQGYVATLNQIVQTSGGDTAKIAEGVGGLAGQIASDIATGLPKMLQTGLAIVQGIITGIVANLPTIVTAAVNVLTTLVGFILQNLPIILQAALQIIITLVNGIASALPTMIPQIVQVIIDLVQILIDNLPMLVDAGIQLLLGLLTGIMAALPILVAALPKLITSLLDALLQAEPMLIEAGAKMIPIILNGIVTSLPILIEALPGMVVQMVGALLSASPLILKAGIDLIVALGKGIFDAVATLIKDLPAIGKGILDGIWAGIQAGFGGFLQNWKNALSGILTSLKDVFGIHSPSVVFAGLGLNMGLGMVEGFAEGVKGFSANVGLPGMSGASSEVGGNSNSYVINVINPKPESASSSVDRTMKTWSFLGTPA